MRFSDVAAIRSYKYLLP